MNESNSDIQQLRNALVQWNGLAGREAKKNPRQRVGTVMNGSKLLVPFPKSIRPTPRFRFSAIDVPAIGNCLYHAVWQSAQREGVLNPFGLRATAHVYTLRVMVAERVAKLMMEGALTDTRTWKKVGSYVAQPDQYLEYSGYIPLMAMASLLRRTIVVIAADGVSDINPINFGSLPGFEESGPPIAIYHCQAADPTASVDFSSRNHYCAVIYEAPNGVILREIVDSGRNGNIAELLDLDTEIIAGNTHQVETIPHNADESDGNYPHQQRRKRSHSSHDGTKKPVPSVTPMCSDQQRHGGDIDKEILRSLSARALTLQHITEQELRALAAGQTFTTCPRLALLFFHCCANNPDAYVFNNESLLVSGSSATQSRLSNALERPLDATGVAQVQARANQTSSARTTILACASCCEIQMYHGIHSHKVRVCDLDDAFKLNQSEILAYMSIPESVRQDHVQVLLVGTELYHLNPDLVTDTENIILCEPCPSNPRAVKYSIASGHDYGRLSDLPQLNEVSAACIAPLRCFGIEISLTGKHSKGHSICFSSDGPVKCSKVLPFLSPEDVPRVTFIGDRDQWRLKKKKFGKLYNLSVDEVYKWLRVLQHTHSGFKQNGIVVDESMSSQNNLEMLRVLVENSVIFHDDVHDTATGIDDTTHADDSNDEAEVVMTQAAVLKPPSEDTGRSSSSILIDTLLELVGDATSPTKHTSALKSKCPSIIPISREEQPFVEWTNNGRMIAFAFPQLFLLGGDNLPTGTWPSDLVNHLLRYYDGRFEKDTKFIALLFNQLQRHTAIQRAAKVGVSNTESLQRFGALVNSERFRNRLVDAKNHPETRSTKRLNAALLRVLSLVGGTVPFSPFERASARPKITALRYRYGVPQHWITIAPPEHDDLILHRIAAIRKLKSWNVVNDIFSQPTCTFGDLPDNLSSSAHDRLSISNQYPALSAQVFQRRLRMIFDDIICSRSSANIRVSCHFAERLQGVFGKVAAHSYVVEPQKDGRLHAHALLYGSTYTPELLTRISCCLQLQKQAAQWLDSVSSTSLHEDVHQWRTQVQIDMGKLPRAFEMELPDAGKDLSDFYRCAEKRIATTNVHVHSSTCFKTGRGKYMCRLARPAGVHEGRTCPILITRDVASDFAHGKRPKFTVWPVDHHIGNAIDRGYDYQSGKLFRMIFPGPIVWELHRSEANKYIVETNRTLAALSQAHTNACIINGEDAGDIVEQYQQNYMTKDSQCLQGGISVLISAIDHINKYPSRADDRDTDVRRGKYAASRTVNAFCGAYEWSHSVLTHAIAGFRSFTSSDSFWYIYPHHLVSIALKGSIKTSTRIGNNDVCDVEVELEELVATCNNDNHHKHSYTEKGHGGGTRAYRVADGVIFVSQAESYIHRGQHFKDYSPLEFECIVDILPINSTPKPSRGRHRRESFPLAASHPLHNYYHGVIRAKQHTPIFAGPPPPSWKPASKKDRLATSRYILATFTNWEPNRFPFSFNDDGLVQLCATWDNIDAPLVNRQRYRFIRNVLKRGHRTTAHEQILTDWRNRNADIWKEMSFKPPDSLTPRQPQTIHDNEKSGLLGDNVDLYDLTQSIISGSAHKRSGFRALRQRLENVMDPGSQAGQDTQRINVYSPDVTHHGLFASHHSDNRRLSDIASRLAAQIQHEDENVDKEHIGNPGIRGSPSYGKSSSSFDLLSSQQQEIWKRVISSFGIDGSIGTQTLTILHGGGGTGKSHVVRVITEEILRRGYEVVSTCTTGAGACQLIKGLTFHSALKIRQKLTANTIEHLKQRFTRKVKLVVIDEVSMLSPNLLLELNERLQRVYGNGEVFGGISILLVGDFFQLQVIKSVSLCKMMYQKTYSSAQILLKKFKVFFLTLQQRANECSQQQAYLQQMRMLPEAYPTHTTWTNDEQHAYKPLSGELLVHFTQQLTHLDVLQDAMWCERSVILVTGNADRAILNSSMARILAKKSGRLVFRWKKSISTTDTNIIRLQDLLYDEDQRPTLFGYFLKGAVGQILDNSNGNVSMGIANGSPCIYHSIAWEDPAKTSTVLGLIEEALDKNMSLVNLPFPPNFINVTLLDRDHIPIARSHWYPHENLASESDGDTVVIPIGVVKSSTEKFFVKIPESSNFDAFCVYYEQHAVDLAMALTIWKAQGNTFDRVILHLEGSSGSPGWGFEHLYVALSRVRTSSHLRCLPLSLGFDRKKMLDKRPKVETIKWIMDINRNGYWSPNEGAVR